MTDVLLLHHVQGRTAGMEALADRIRAGGHTVTAPDLFDGRTFDSIGEGIAFASEVGFGALAERGVAAGADLPDGAAVIGVSLGVMAAQQLAQTRPGIGAAVFLAGCLPPSEFGTWPEAVPVQIHGAEGDEIFMGEGDVDAAREVVAVAERGELFLYRGEAHLYMDSSLHGYDEEATDRTVERILELLGPSSPASE